MNSKDQTTTRALAPILTIPKNLCNAQPFQDIIMNPLKVLSFFVVLFCWQSAFSQKDWIKFSPKDKDFEVMVPGEMRDGQKKLLTDVGEMFPTTWVYTDENSKDPNFLYMVSIIEYPELTFDLNDEEFISQFFDETLEQHLQDMNGELVYSAAMPMGLYPGKLFRAKWRNDEFVVRGRLVLVGDRFYMLQVYTETSYSLNNEAQYFLESLKVKG